MFILIDAVDAGIKSVRPTVVGQTVAKTAF